MDEFYNPYQFVPLKANKNAIVDQYKVIKEGKSKHIRHDKWVEGTHSGKIICQLKTLTPTIVGGKRKQESREEEGPSKLCQYTNAKDQCVIPASSLRGMISSLVESISQSSMRILQNNQYSMRQEVGKGLSAIGMLHRKKDGKLGLLPLCLPTIANRHVEKKWGLVFKNKKLQDILKVYIGLYRNNDQNRDQNNPLMALSSFHFENAKDFVYLKLYSELTKETLTPENSKLPGSNDSLHIKSNKFCLAQKALPREFPINKRTYDGKPKDVQKQYTRGVLFVLGKNGAKADNLPDSKKHELFIPFSPETEKSIYQNLLEVSGKALDDYNAIAMTRWLQDAESNRGDYPFLPKGYPRHSDTPRKPQHGDLIYFDCDDDFKVTKISYSSTWRDLAPRKTWKFISDSKEINSDLLPWNKNRKSLTAAEAMFGVVETGEEGEELGEHSRNLAGRVNFSEAGNPISPIELHDELLLNPLLNPKVPSPAMYFRPLGGSEPFSANKLHEHNFMLSGRKFFIPYVDKQPIEAKLYNTDIIRMVDNPHLKTVCKPLKQGQTLYFSIDFENLTNAELELLLVSLAPCDNFIHRLGYGKPFGLGEVEIKPLGLASINRRGRYSYKGISAPRFDNFQQFSTLDENQHKVMEKYLLGFKKENCRNFKAKQLDKYTHISKGALARIQQLGLKKSMKQCSIVSYPFTEQQKDNRGEEGFKWFQENKCKENGFKQILTSKYDFPPKPMSSPMVVLSGTAKDPLKLKGLKPEQN